MGREEDELFSFIQDEYDPRKIVAPDVKTQPRGVKRVVGLIGKGATLGFTGSDIEPEGIGESLLQMGGELAPIALTGGVVGGALRAGRAGQALARLGPKTSQLVGAGAGGAAFGGAKELVSGEQPSIGSVAQKAAEEALLWGGTELIPIGYQAWKAKKAATAAAGKINIPDKLVDTSTQVERILDPGVAVETEKVAQAAASQATADPINEAVTRTRLQTMFGRLPNDYEMKVAMAAKPVELESGSYKVVRPSRMAELRQTTPEGEVIGREFRLQDAPVIIDNNTGKIASLDDYALPYPKALEEEMGRLRGVPFESLNKPLSVRTDPATGRKLYETTSPEAEDVVKQVRNSTYPRATGIPVPKEQFEAPSTAQQINAMVSEKSGPTTSELLKRPGGKTFEVDLDNNIIMLDRMAEIAPTAKDKDIRQFAAAQNIPYDEMASIFKNARQMAEKMGFETVERKVEEVEKLIKLELHKRCM